VSDHPRDGGDPDGCATCEAPLLYEIDYEKGTVFLICSGGCGRAQLGPALVAKLMPEIENPGPIER
jgi:hypothetical protein